MCTVVRRQVAACSTHDGYHTAYRCYQALYIGPPGAHKYELHAGPIGVGECTQHKAIHRKVQIFLGIPQHLGPLGLTAAPRVVATTCCGVSRLHGALVKPVFSPLYFQNISYLLIILFTGYLS